ncbi:Telomere repeat-binding factor 4 [Cucurbita argyrosperma subsp. argyrosperma]|uniref:telomere repeat-binding factor 4-like n=1 Tax=Cucurbita pepo subsp. pepo TaxID=3664 RepID=UPI000C9D9592|nr:telomere repeat-binding factor 4-like [Cucurbita pepo subsp. pepo]KAG7018274.1 Telomere repeat-binding factor 4 [Cucurbita argyrosperma subsp. argyrosperma]
MGNQKLKWTSEEEEALLAGVNKHGPGKWKNILKDPEFAPSLTHRSNIDLKDKWRNLSVSTASQGSKEKSRAPKAKAIVAAISNHQNSAPAKFNASADTAGDDTPNNSTQDGKNVPRYYTMIFEALSTIKDSNGCDIGTIVNFIKQRHEVPQNFRRQLSSKLRRLVSQGKLEKVQNCYQVKKDNSLAVNTPTPKQKDVRQRISQYTMGGGMPSGGDTLEDAAKAAAYKVADAENKSFLAAEAVKEAERIAKMAEDTDSMLQIIKEIYEKCSRGESILLA